MQGSAEHFKLYTLETVSEAVDVTCRAGSFFKHDSFQIQSQDIGKDIQIKNATNNSITKEITG